MSTEQASLRWVLLVYYHQTDGLNGKKTSLGKQRANQIWTLMDVDSKGCLSTSVKFRREQELQKVQPKVCSQLNINDWSSIIFRDRTLIH